MVHIYSICPIINSYFLKRERKKQNKTIGLSRTVVYLWAFIRVTVNTCTLTSLDEPGTKDGEGDTQLDPGALVALLSSDWLAAVIYIYNPCPHVRLSYICSLGYVFINVQNARSTYCQKQRPTLPTVQRQPDVVI